VRAVTAKGGRAGRANDQSAKVVEMIPDNEFSVDISKESICDPPSNAGEIIALAISKALDALEGRFA